MTTSEHAFSDEARLAVYRAIRERRDMRHFSGGTVADDVLQRLLKAAHHAPSVGFMQPWRFIRIRIRALRESLHALVEQERVLTAQALGEREDEFMQLKVQGVLDAAEVLVVALPPGREQHIFGRRTSAASSTPCTLSCMNSSSRWPKACAVSTRSCSTSACRLSRKARLRMRMKRQGCMKPTLGA